MVVVKNEKKTLVYFNPCCPLHAHIIISGLSLYIKSSVEKPAAIQRIKIFKSIIILKQHHYMGNSVNRITDSYKNKIGKAQIP